VKVITSVSEEWQKDSIRILQKGMSVYKKNWLLIIILTLGAGVLTWGVLAPVGFLIGWKRDRIVGRTSLQVKVVAGASRLHAKMYIVDDAFVATGSLNYTSSGFWKNVEHVDYHEGEAAQSIIKQFTSIWNTSSGIKPYMVSRWDLNYLSFKIGNIIPKIRTGRK